MATSKAAAKKAANGKKTTPAKKTSSAKKGATPITGFFKPKPKAASPKSPKNDAVTTTS
eukprot:CAMPEP_0183740280 /NCGR_PEP_ID=MMETSP0737-20130205/59197_1 /TAXON_ID=385413 /ORGANISM="Thalassiosira miniscula, Strain CCMP1093" /LENGTH=58 /DNA_ID=CAMNT_0025975291 /DNA_START=155 /DNA_END=328 /DNA_ORIENTATION=+